jgi:hypothetical protein
MATSPLHEYIKGDESLIHRKALTLVTSDYGVTASSPRGIDKSQRVKYNDSRYTCDIHHRIYQTTTSEIAPLREGLSLRCEGLRSTT